MTAIEFLKIVKGHARRVRTTLNAQIRLDAHMHSYTGPDLPQEAIDAILVAFINQLAGQRWCLDYALYASELAKPEPERPHA